MGKEREIKTRGIGIIPKILISFLVLSCVPLIVIGYIGDRNLRETGLETTQRAEEMGAKNLISAKGIGRIAVEDSVRALDEKATEAIEVRTVDLALRIADFLYERDEDILVLATLEPDPQVYLDVYRSSNRDVIAPEPWPPEKAPLKPPMLQWKNPENRVSWRHHPPHDFRKIRRPLYREFTFIDLKGRERIKVSDGRLRKDLKDISDRRNTFCKAEGYFSDLGGLKRGEIYVSRVIGPYVKGWLQKGPKGIEVAPESAYAGKENPEGEAFMGIVRWATPVFDKAGEKVGYVTMALDHIHIMEFTDHLVPTQERYSDISDAGSGNYAFMWDDQGQCISHPRDFFVCGYDPAIGEEVPGWISEATYNNEFIKSGLSLAEFVRRLPSFNGFSLKKPGSRRQGESGCISLDCRVLDTAPQCQGWHRGTEDGGSGSFLIHWSGLWKLTTYATIPYYTGIYGNSKRGFGYVTIGANVEDFHKAAAITKQRIEKSIQVQGEDIKSATEETRAFMVGTIARNRNLAVGILIISALVVAGASVAISLKITKPLRRLTSGAIAMGKGDLHQSINVKSTDEIGLLAKSFNEMAASVSELDQMKSEFVTIASHELRTPIHAMLLSISGVLEGYSGEINEEIREDLDLAKDGIKRLTRLVEDLLDLSRMEARKIDFNMAIVPVAEITDSAVQEVLFLARSHHHVIINKVPRDLPDIDVDRDRIVQVMVNLLSNSIKYTPDGGTLIIEAETGKDKVIFSFADNGFGMPESATEKVFEKFFQADKIMSQEVGGSGLGLTIAKGIIEGHGGDILCISPVPKGRSLDLPLGGERKGSVFIFRLPIHIS